MGSVIGPDEIGPVAAESGGRAGAGAIGELLVLVLEHLASEIGVGHDDGEGGAEPDGHDGAVLLGPLGEAPEPYGLDFVEVANDGPRPGPGGQPRAEAEVKSEDNGEGGEASRDEIGAVHSEKSPEICSARGGSGDGLAT